MTQEINYGVISDVHQDPRIVPATIEVLKKLGAEKLLINGDIGNQQRSLEDSQNYVAFILDSIGKSELESYVQPGSHETIGAYQPVIEHYARKFSNIVNVLEERKIETGNHDLVFLPGSDFVCGGEYRIGGGKHDTGEYVLDVHGELIPQTTNKKELQRLSDIGKISGMTYHSNMNDLRKLVTNPDKTIVVCHVPRKFDNLEYAVDMAEFGEATERFNLNGNNVEQGSVFPLPVAQQIVQAGYPVEIKKENRGNEYLKLLYEALGINKSVSGHFHESGHRANDRQGNHVQEGRLVDELFWNSGHLDVGQTGILTVGDGKVSYRNIQLQDYIK